MSKASQLIAEFEVRTGGAFPNIRRGDVAAGLKERIADRWMIDQGEASLCGPAALVYSVLRKSRTQYVKYVTSLYDSGWGRLGQSPGIYVEPGGDCKNFDPADRIPPVDWVALASLCDSENGGFDYQDTSDKAAGITFPATLSNWLEKCDFSNLRNATNASPITKDRENLELASNLHLQGNRVCLFCKGKTLRGEEGAWYDVPTHWATMTKPATFKGDNVSLQVQSWGDLYDLDVSVSLFLSTYFGFVSGRP